MSEVLVLNIEDVAFGGKGVARHEGRVIFVPFTAPGDVVQAQVMKAKKNFAEARLSKVLTPSPDRVEPLCPYFTGCGGCIYQHIRYETQLAIKTKQVADTLRRVGKLGDVPMRPVIPSVNPWGYRNRIRVHREDGITGFYMFESRRIIDVEHCRIAQPEVNKALSKLRNSKVEDGDYSLRAPGGAGPFFEQTNAQVTRALVELLDSTLRRDQALFVDAYCGGGLFAKALASHAQRVIGIESNEAAIGHARKNAGESESYVHGDVSEHLAAVLAPHDSAKTTVLLDPPSEGVAARVTDILLEAAPAEIAYVACNPATLARDLALLKSAYRIESVTPLDMFPHTAEIEVFAHLVRTEA